LKILYIHSTQIDSAKANLIQVISMCNAFQYNKVSVDLALPEPIEPIEDVKSFVSSKFGMEVHFNIIFYEKYSNNRIIEKYFGIKSVERIIKGSDADFVFTRLPKYIGPVLKQNRKLIFESHNNKLHNRYPRIDKYWKKKILKKIKNNNFVSFISISQSLTGYWTQLGIPKEKQLSLHDGFPKDFFIGVRSNKKIREELNISLEEKIAMYIGSLYPDREIENILEAALEIPSLNFYIVGGPEIYKQYYQEMADRMGLKNVKFFGYISHSKVPELLMVADYLLGLWSKKVPTIDYCSPLKIFEYMASGKLVIAHGFKTIKEVLIDEQNALLVNPDRKNDLALVLKKALTTNTDSLREKSKKLVYEEYTWEKRAKHIIDYLNRA